MSMDPVIVGARLAEAAEACGLKLQEDPFAEVVRCLGPLGQPASAFDLLSRITSQPDSGTETARIAASISPDHPGQNDVERTLLLLACQHAIPGVASLPVSESVKALFAEEFASFANPPASWTSYFEASHVRYREMARIATLRRFPAGQFHWEDAGFPRSWVAQARRPLSLLTHVVRRMGGFSPVFELHVNDRRKNRLVLLEKEAGFSYYRAARAVEKQPAIRGVMTGSWLFSESTARITPRLAWLRAMPEAGGAFIAELGPAPADSGFLVGSDERRKLYDEGIYRPNVAYVLWPRKALIEWANSHPEFDR